MALAKASLYFRYGRPDEDGLPAAERALELDPELAEPHAVRARYLVERDRIADAMAELAIARELAPTPMRSIWRPPMQISGSVASMMQSATTTERRRSWKQITTPPARC